MAGDNGATLVKCQLKPDRVRQVNIQHRAGMFVSGVHHNDNAMLGAALKEFGVFFVRDIDPLDRRMNFKNTRPPLNAPVPAMSHATPVL